MSAVSVIIPASNEAALIGRCLKALCASDWPPDAGLVQVIVVANGCRDDTATRARAMGPAFAERGWRLQVIEREQGGKPGALNAGDAAALAGIRVYLDADVTVDRWLLAQLHEALSEDGPRYSSGTVRITAKGAVSRGYARIWRQVPFMSGGGVPGCGVFAVNAAGRARWQDFPEIISDDTFVRLHFAPSERVGVSAPYDWPVAEGFGALVRVRRRQDAGVDQIARDYPGLLANDDDRPFPASQKLAMAGSDPFGFALYSAVALVSRLTRHRAQGWSRAR